MRKAVTSALLLGFLLATPLAAPAQAPGPDDLARLDLLPAFKRSVKVGSVSSYDRTGGNDDGFSGKHSFVRKEPGGLVIADLTGPGVVTRMWTPTPNDTPVEFYFDGETTPRITVTFADLFSGKQFPFLAPVSGVGAGGFYTYAPIPYAKSLKILYRGDHLMFYQINYAIWPADAKVASFTPSDDYRTALERARALLAKAGADVSAHAAPPGAALQTRRAAHGLRPGETLRIFESDEPGRVVGLRLTPASAFAGKARDVRLRAFWDGETRPAIDCPVSDFFGYSWGDPATRSLLLGTSGDTNYAYLPMPYDRSARVELVNERAGGPPVEVEAEVVFANVGRRPDEGRFYAVRRRANPVPEGRPHVFVETEGRGHLVGVILQAQGLEPGAIPEFFEGDDETTLDGELVVRGTGSEDFFNGGWYDVPGRWEDRVSLPLSGSLDFKRHLGRTGGYRFLIADAYPFSRSIRSTIEHGPVGNKFPADYTSVTFFYLDRPPAAAVGPASPAELPVADPTRAVFTPGWTTPIHAFSWSNASLAKKTEKLGGVEYRYLSLEARGREVFGDHYISFLLEMPATGRYHVSVEGLQGPAQGRAQIFLNEVPVGDAVDFYAPERRVGPVAPMGELDLNEGLNRVMFKVVGADARAAARNFDVYRIVCERVGP